ncbi:MAG: rhodanese-like domain-containing protein [Bacteroidota bacterium]|jgi:adenylyltransferase/sulfurtransferase
MQAIKEVTVRELKRMMDEKKDFQLIDVREPDEFEFCNIGGELIPMGQLVNSIDRISKEKMTVFLCRSGVRSARAVGALQQRFGFMNLYNVTGGILAWSDEIDPNVPKY